MTRKMKINPQSKNRSVWRIWRRAKLVQRSSLKLIGRVRPKARSYRRARRRLRRRARLIILRKLVHQMIRTQPNGENKKTPTTLSAPKPPRQKLVGHQERLLQTNTYSPKGYIKTGFTSLKTQQTNLTETKRWCANGPLNHFCTFDDKFALLKNTIKQIKLIHYIFNLLLHFYFYYF